MSSIDRFGNPARATTNDELVMNFQEDYQKLMRGLIDSQTRENQLQRELNRMKEDIIAHSLRLQVAVLMAEDDEKLVKELKRETEESRRNEAFAVKQATDAADLIRALRQEASELKRSVKELMVDRPPKSATKQSGPSPNPVDSHTHIFSEADKEVTELLSKSQQLTLLRRTAGDAVSFSPFQQWKVKQFRYSTNTPAASQFHDYQTVTMLNTLHNLLGDPAAAAGFEEAPVSTSSSRKASDATLPRATGKDRVEFILPGETAPAPPMTGSIGGSGGDQHSSSMGSLSRSTPAFKRLTLSRVGKLNPQAVASMSAAAAASSASQQAFDLPEDLGVDFSLMDLKHLSPARNLASFASPGKIRPHSRALSSASSTPSQVSRSTSALEGGRSMFSPIR